MTRRSDSYSSGGMPSRSARWDAGRTETFPTGYRTAGGVRLRPHLNEGASEKSDAAEQREPLKGASEQVLRGPAGVSARKSTNSSMVVSPHSEGRFGRNEIPTALV